MYAMKNPFYNILVSVKCLFFYQQRVQEIVAAHDVTKPLFVYLPFANVHSPVQAPQEYVDKYSFIEDKLRRTYAAMVDIMDEAVGNVTKAFMDKGYAVF